jgi:prepilin-type N-terminal cleavage/methylation domain-containing protein
MVRKSTISKVLTHHLDKGFTLLELLVGLVIMSIVGGLALNAIVEAGKSYGSDKRNIESNQNLSAVLEIIGNDIKQAGEQISENTFPVVSIEPNAAPGSMPGSSIITIRRAVAPRLTLCQNIPASTSSLTSLIVADSALTTDPTCNVTAASISTNSTVLLPVATSASALSPALTRQTSLMTARSARCKLDEPGIKYDDPSFVNTDFCQPTKPVAPAIDREKVRAAMVDATGVDIWTFDYLDDVVTTGASTQHRMTIGQVDRTTQAVSPATTTPAVVYPPNTAIYLIEERTYSLAINGDLLLLVEGETSPQVLMSGIQSFNISAKIYNDTTAKTIAPTPTGACTLAQDPDTPTSPTAANPKYACTFTPGPAYDWKTLAGIKVKLQAKYDSTGQNTYTLTQLSDPNATDPNILKLRASAEFFPRNVLTRN